MAAVFSHQSVQLPARHLQPLSLERLLFLLLLLHHLRFRRFRLNVNRLLLSRCQEDVRCNVLVQILFRRCLLHFLHLLHHLLLPHFGRCRHSHLSAVLRECKEGCFNVRC